MNAENYPDTMGGPNTKRESGEQRQFLIHFVALLGFAVTRGLDGWALALIVYIGLLGTLYTLSRFRRNRTPKNREPVSMPAPSVPSRADIAAMPGRCQWCGLRPVGRLCGGRSDGGPCEAVPANMPTEAVAGR